MFINLTPHVIRIVGANTETQEEQVLEILPSGKVVICCLKRGETTAQRLDQFEFYVTSRDLGKVLVMVQNPTGGDPKAEEFPKRADGVIYLVSSMVQEAMNACPDVLAPDTGPTAIRDEKGLVWAVTRLIGPA